MKKTLFFSTIMLLLVVAAHAQFQVNADGNSNIPSGKSLYIGNFGDSGYRMRFVNLSTYSIIDYNPDLYFRSAASGVPTRVIFKTNGYVGINTTSPSYLLDVNGTMRASGYVTLSDIRLKKNISSLGNALTKISNLSGITYQYNADIKIDRVSPEGDKFKESLVSADSRGHIGFSAQQVKKVFPELVHEDENGYLGVDYMSLIPVLVEAIKEQQVLIDELRKKVR